MQTRLQRKLADKEIAIMEKANGNNTATTLLKANDTSFTFYEHNGDVVITFTTFGKEKAITETRGIHQKAAAKLMLKAIQSDGYRIAGFNHLS